MSILSFQIEDYLSNIININDAESILRCLNKKSTFSPFKKYENTLRAMKWNKYGNFAILKLFSNTIEKANWFMNKNNEFFAFLILLIFLERLTIKHEGSGSVRTSNQWRNSKISKNWISERVIHNLHIENNNNNKNTGNSKKTEKWS